MARLIVHLGRSRSLHRMVAILRIFPLAELILTRFPLRRRVKGSDFVYRVTSLDQLSTEIEVFKLETYAPALDSRPVNTFIDLGCNAGWFALWLSARQPNERRIGLLVDAHPRMIAEANWLLRRNGLLNYQVIHGAVGLPPSQSSAIFYLHPSSSASSLAPYQPTVQIPAKGSITKVTVPAISLDHEWSKAFGGALIDLLKIDIEGNELDLVNHEGQFLAQRVRRIVVEWHKWIVSLSQLDGQLSLLGFVRRGVHSEGGLTGLAVYDNRQDV